LQEVFDLAVSPPDQSLPLMNERAGLISPPRRKQPLAAPVVAFAVPAAFIGGVDLKKSLSRVERSVHAVLVH
jgi:hypothetical protein